MYRPRRSRDAEETAIDLTPMLDVVFIMLIFFVVTTSFVKESGIEINRPVAQTSERVETGNLLIAITPQGEIWLAGEPVALEAVRSQVERLRTERPEGSVIIQGDTGAPIGLLVKVMDQVRLAGVTRLAIAAHEAGQ
ncbi:MAG: biopolymer transporter ExbD [Pseudomonadota bacterium]|nr:biopolymer transporter ExbD [Pseudomonadota bacterium]